MAKKKLSKKTEEDSLVKQDREKRKIARLRSWKELSFTFMKQQFGGNYDKNWDRYENNGNSSSKMNFASLKNKNILWINTYYPNIELMKGSITFNNPRIFAKSKKQSIPTSTGEVMGSDRAIVVQDYLNWINREINTKITFGKVRDDALIGNFGVCMVMWNTEAGVGETPDDIYIKKDQQALLYLYPKDFGVDPECTDPYEFTDARWCYRRIVMPLEWAKEKFNAPDLKATSTAFGASDDGTTQLKRDVNKSTLIDTDDLKRIVLTEFWIKPTPSERERGRKGKLVVIADGYNGDTGHGIGILKEEDWPYRMEGFPFSGIRFNDRNDSFYGVPDFQQYEDQVEEKSLLRTFQLQNAHYTSNIKAVVNTEQVDDSDEQNLKNGTPNTMKVRGDVRTAVKYETPGSVSSEFYTIDQKNEGDLDNQSGINDLKRGNVGKSDSATEAAIAQKNTDVRFKQRLEKSSDLYLRVQKKFVQLAKEFLDEETTIQVINDPSRAGSFQGPFTKADLEGDFDIRLHVSEMAPMSAEKEQQKLIQYFGLLTQLTQNPLIMQLLQQEGTTLSITKMLFELQRLADLESLGIIQNATNKDQFERGAILQQAQQSGNSGGGNGSSSSVSPGLFQSQANTEGSAFRGIS